ncbi:MAG: hypothetical protein KGV48_000120 [Alcaligenaceae bacterium]|nr:hypothetical protein [Alcaligenaceae bacterium]
MDIKAYWDAIVKQDDSQIRPFFSQEASIHWHNTDEHFSVDEFIKVNCTYPGQWDYEIKHSKQLDHLLITAVRVFDNTQHHSFHVVSFIQTQNDKITLMDEYWGEDGEIPQWRQALNVSKTII